MRTYNLSLDIFNYIEELYCISRVCERPTIDGEKCVQCREKERVINRLKAMLLQHYEETPYRERIANQWPPSKQEQL